MSQFFFHGTIPASKSLLNRLLILKSYQPALKIRGDSDCDDVKLMKQGLATLATKSEADCGSAGTTFRFLALRASRMSGKFFLRGTARLMARPQEELEEILHQLGVSVKLFSDGIEIIGEGWQKPAHELKIPSSRSSQFASAVLLNSWDLPFDLSFSLSGDVVSEGYFAMSLQIAKRAGLQVASTSEGFALRAKQMPSVSEIEAETDLSSAFAVAALGAIAGHVEIENFPAKSLQPDRVFPEILNLMGAQVGVTTGMLQVSAPERLHGVEVDLRSSPDLFPVLGILCALAEGPSRLFGAPQLAHKESSRIEKTAELIRLLGRNVEASADGLMIEGSLERNWQKPIVFDPDQDHRLAMAAAVAKVAGAPIVITTPEVVQKSYPAFWEMYDSSLRDG